ncbi:hypothetical protein PIB30_045642 [Stylosanthes scabra]|uniref:Uncharacterized protein n=1 Tax=Stylosanthes scabra TaxID=79078 RepID=A0ABU6WJL9_9FABA|nr:hypothetical protein [Stylosanthes scabra]
MARTGRVRRMPKGGGHRRAKGGGGGWGEGGRGRREGGDKAPSQQSQGGASTSHVNETGMSTHIEIPAAPRSQQGVSTPPPSALHRRHSSRDLIARGSRI